MINFQAALKALTEQGVNFVVVGGYAATLYGSGYLTRDLDICYERTPENMARLVSALQPIIRACVGLPFLFDVRTLSQGMNFTLETDLGDIDLLGRIDGVGELERQLQRGGNLVAAGQQQERPPPAPEQERHHHQ